jgi:ethanolamine utilization microcompartment shell protein EutL
MNNDDLDPHIVDAMRSIPAVDPAIRETHIAAAIEQASTSTFTYSSPSRQRSYGRIGAAAAAVVVVVAGSFVVGRSSASSPDVPVVSAPSTTIVKAGLPTCADQFDGDAELVHTYEVDDVEFAIVNANGETIILETRSCSYITHFTPQSD